MTSPPFMLMPPIVTQNGSRGNVENLYPDRNPRDVKIRFAFFLHICYTIRAQSNIGSFLNEHLPDNFSHHRRHRRGRAGPGRRAGRYGPQPVGPDGEPPAALHCGGDAQRGVLRPGGRRGGGVRRSSGDVLDYDRVPVHLSAQLLDRQAGPPHPQPRRTRPRGSPRP